VQIRSAECVSCLECVAVCPAKDALFLQWGGRTKWRRVLPAWQVAAGIAVIFLGLVGYAKVSDHWQTHLPREVFLQFVPAANAQHHPTIGKDLD
jgi:ferredoxin